MKRFFKTAALLLAMLMTCSAFVACGGTEKNEEDTIYAVVINKGYGTDWTDALLKRFCELNPQYNYEIEKVYSDDQIIDKIESGAQYCRWDLAFNGATYAADTEYLLPLNDVYESTIESGSRAGTTIISHIDESALKGIAKQEDGKDVYYAMPWTAQVGGVCVNVDAVKKVLGDSWREDYPCRTTEEFKVFCEALKTKGLEPLMHAANNDYMLGLANIWFYQYNGVQGISNYYEGKFEGPNGLQVGAEVAKNTGVLRAYELVEELGKAGYYCKDGYGLEWDTAQTMFMSGKTAMLSIGDWVQTEMSKQYPNVDVQYIRYPVISALASDVLGITDAELASIIDYVDGKTATAPEFTSTKNMSKDDVIKRVDEARRMSGSYVNNFTVCIPEYSKKADIAKEFLKFMVSDEGQKIYSLSTNGLTMCYGYDMQADTEVWNQVGEFAKTRWPIVKNAIFVVRDRWESFGKAGLKPFRASDKGSISILLSRDSNRWTAQQAYEYDYETYQKEWASLVAKIQVN